MALVGALMAWPVAAQDDADDDGGGFLESLIEDRLSGPGFEVQVRGFEGALSSRATLEQLIISDDDGPWLTVNDVVLDWNRAALLRGRLSVDEFTAAEILLPRLPQGDDSVDVPSPEAQPFSLPDLPVSIQIGRIAAERVALGQPVLGQEVELTLEGSASLADGDGEVNIDASRLDRDTGTYRVAGSYESGSRALALDLQVNEGASGIVGTLIDLPGRPSLELSVQGDGPLSAFTAEIALATAGEPRLSGTVSLREVDGAQGFAVDLGGDIAPVFTPQYRPFFGPDIQLIAEGARSDDGAIRLSSFDLSAQSLTLQGQVSIGPDGVPDLIDVTGQIAGQGGSPVVLPVGSDLRVGRVGLDVQFDSAQGDAWTGDIVVEQVEQPGLDIARIALDGGGVIAGSGDTLAVETNFDFAATGLSFDDGGVAEAVGDSIDGRLEVDYAAGQDIVMEVLRLAGAGFRLTGDGRVDPDGERIPVSLQAQLDADDLAVFSSLAGRSLAGGVSVDLGLDATVQDQAFSVTLDGSGQDLAVGIAQLDPLLAGGTTLALAAQRDAEGLRVSRLALDNDELALDGTARIASNGGEATLSARVNDLSRVDPELSGPATLSLQADSPQGVAWSVALEAEGAEADVSVDATVSDLGADVPQIAGDIRVDAQDLSNFSSFAGRDLGGAVNLTTQVVARADASSVLADVAGQVRDVAVGIPEVDRLLAGLTELSTNLVKVGDSISLPRLSVQNDQLSVAGNARVQAQNSLVDLDVRLPDLSQVVPSMRGPATLVLDAAEDADGWEVDLDVDGAGARITADGRVTELDNALAPLGTGTVTIRADDLGAFSEIARRELGGSVDLSAEGRARFDLSLAELDLNGQTRDLALGQPELNRLFAGLTQIVANVAKDGDQISVPQLSLQNPQVDLSANGQYGPGQNAIQANLSFPELGQIVPEMSGPGTVALFAEEVGELWQVSVDGDGAGVMLSVMASVSDLDATPLVDGTIELQASDLSRFRRLANRPLRGSLSLDAQGQARIDGSRFDVTADVNANGLAVGIAQVDQLLNGTTTLDLSASRDGADAPIRVRTFTLDSPGLDATANGTLLGGSSNLSLDARLANLGAFVEGINGPVTVTGRAGQAGSNFTVDVDVTGPQGIQAEISGQVAESFDRANLRIDGSTPLRLANPFIEPRSVVGQADFNVAINGPLQLSSVSGTVTVQNGRFVEPSLPLVLEDLNATARLDGQNLQLTATARNQQGGEVRVSGPIALSGGFNADLTIELNNLDLEDPRLYKTQLDGRITVNGPLTGGATVSGRIDLDETELRIPSTGLGATGPIPEGLVHVNEPADVRRTRARAGLIEEPGSGGGGGGGAAYPLDLLISAPNRIFVRGRGLDAELGGRLQLGGTTANVIPSGQFDLIRGRLDLLGKRLVLTDGRVSLQGNFSPFIRLVAETDAGDVTVRIVIEGDALSPDINFLSDPDLPEDEVLSRLLFGRSIDDISPLQAAQLASAVATLAGRGGDGVIANLRQKTGLDDLDVTTDEDGNVGLRAGKYLSENLYTDVTVGADGEAEINLNLDLTNTITVRGGASNSGETTLGIFFEKDY
ncbi:translocation/assembly module TamB domain-containing protein [Maribius pontilimi]|uniref:Translocation/assembly module TamB domain-containing protein n=1 Tax=Palleronia pontilimi TaxID=1964209 RepID=A0A934IFF4_9RHOB|nr:translocation/assembly module TamB domain-containing protein [Palleronia pontilimi]MBJ3761615.1 translocation/assembly module TamB domain-containing protein [Palleronia pontilimi]